MEQLQNIVLTVILAVLCSAIAWMIKANKQRILAYTEELIQRAENAVQGSGLGTQKKAMVVARLETAGVTVTSWLSGQIDSIVAALNSKGAWLTQQTQEAAGLSDTATKEG